MSSGINSLMDKSEYVQSLGAKGVKKMYPQGFISHKDVREQLFHVSWTNTLNDETME